MEKMGDTLRAVFVTDAVESVAPNALPFIPRVRDGVNVSFLCQRAMEPSVEDGDLRDGREHFFNEFDPL